MKFYLLAVIGLVFALGCANSNVGKSLLSSAPNPSSNSSSSSSPSPKPVPAKILVTGPTSLIKNQCVAYTISAQDASGLAFSVAAPTTIQPPAAAGPSAPDVGIDERITDITPGQTPLAPSNTLTISITN